MNVVGDIDNNLAVLNMPTPSLVSATIFGFTACL
jgi:hypothetical protein